MNLDWSSRLRFELLLVGGVGWGGWLVGELGIQMI